MKWKQMRPGARGFRVAPLAGAWIEMHKVVRWSAPQMVAPLAGAWIEITRDR